MKILLFNNIYPNEANPTVGTYVKSIVNQLSDMGYEVDICVRTPSKHKTISYLCFYWKLLTISLKKYDILYVNHFTFLLPLIVRLVLSKNKKVIYHWHGEELINSHVLFRIIRILIKKSFHTDVIHISPSFYYKKVINNVLNVSKEKIFVSQSGGVDMNCFHCHQHPSSIFHIGFPAALNEHKGVLYLLEILKNSKKLEEMLNEKIHFHIINYGSESRKVKEFIKVYYPEKVTIYPTFKKEELSHFYSQTNMTLFLSKRESLGLTVLESMSCGVPVLARNNSSMPELVVTGISGELVSNEPSVEEILEKIKIIHDNLLSYNSRDFIVDKQLDKISVQNSLKSTIENFIKNKNHY